MRPDLVYLSGSWPCYFCTSLISAGNVYLLHTRQCRDLPPYFTRHRLLSHHRANFLHSAASTTLPLHPPLPHPPHPPTTPTNTPLRPPRIPDIHTQLLRTLHPLLAVLTARKPLLRQPLHPADGALKGAELAHLIDRRTVRKVGKEGGGRVSLSPGAERFLCCSAGSGMYILLFVGRRREFNGML